MTNPIQFVGKSKNGNQETFIIYPKPNRVTSTLDGKVVETTQLPIIKTVDGRNVYIQKDDGLIIEGESNDVYYPEI